jgi:5-methylcytosine-specific restriction endonuclease McrA
MTKECRKCGETKPTSEFYKSPKHKDGLRSSCKRCFNKACNAQQRRNRDAKRRWDEAKVGVEPLYFRVRAHGSRARQVGAPVEDFKTADLLAWWESQGIKADECIYCGGPFEQIDHKTPLSRGGGHTVQNCVPACAKCNMTKHTQTAVEFVINRASVA